MTRTISIRLEEELYRALEKTLAGLKSKSTRNRAINEAIEDYIKKIKRDEIRLQLEKESKAGRNESMRILKEFDATDSYDFD